MTSQATEAVVVGGGQAGIALSEHLSNHGIAHIVLERGRIAERWRSCRWDSLVANGPAWHDRFPNLEFSDYGQDDFVPKERVATYFEDYVKQINAPIHCGVEVTRVRKNAGAGGFIVETSNGAWQTKNVIAATGAFQKPVIPQVIPNTQKVLQIHSADYKNPQQLPAGAVLVVGSGSSGAQIAQELNEAGREVYLSISAHDRPPRRYRGRDNVWWLGVLGKWEMPTPTPGTKHVTIAVSGAHGGQTIDFRRFAAAGVTLVGRSESFADGAMHFADDLRENLDYGDKNYFSVLDEADAYIAHNGLDLPAEPQARELLPDPACVREPILRLNLNEAGVGSVIWATGYAFDFSWLGGMALDDHGRPSHYRGISSEPGIYFMGLPWQSRRGSSFIWGAWRDAQFIAEQIAIHKHYQAYQPAQ